MTGIVGQRRFKQPFRDDGVVNEPSAAKSRRNPDVREEGVPASQRQPPKARVLAGGVNADAYQFLSKKLS